MAEVLVEFDAPLVGTSGRRYRVRVCGCAGEDGLWEGWLEFVPADGRGRALRSPRETTQPNRTDLAYWATGLTPVYLEGAFQRAIDGPRPSGRAVTPEPIFDGPAPAVAPAASSIRPRPVLNPFEVYAQGEEILRQQLIALDSARLNDIIDAYGLDEGYRDERPITAPALVAFVLGSVREHARGTPAARRRGESEAPGPS